MHFNPKDQILLLAGLLPDDERHAIWTLPDLDTRLERLRGEGLIDDDGLSDPGGLAAARRIRHIRLDDLVAEHLTEGIR